MDRTLQPGGAVMATNTRPDTRPILKLPLASTSPVASGSLSANHPALRSVGVAPTRGDTTGDAFDSGVVSDAVPSQVTRPDITAPLDVVILRPVMSVPDT